MSHKKSKERHVYENIRILAVAAVQTQDKDYFIRKVTRTFSTTFHVPITEAEKLPVEEMLQHIWEHQYENMKPEELARVAQSILSGEDEKTAEEKAMDEDEYWVHQELEKFQAEEEVKRQKQAAEKTVKKEPPPDLSIKFDEDK